MVKTLLENRQLKVRKVLYIGIKKYPYKIVHEKFVLSHFKGDVCDMDYIGYTNQRLYHRIAKNSILNSSVGRHIFKTQRINSNFNNSRSQANFERAN